jgi:DNA helicase-2/ATP-dependent DNA helicase PcrA
MAHRDTESAWLEGLNAQQRAAATHDDGPLLIIAGAGTGKTRTLVHRVAHLIRSGIDPGRVLLLTFTRRAAAEMLRRAEPLLRDAGSRRAGSADVLRRLWGGTFHAVATRLLRQYGNAVGLEPGFTIHDRSDSEDLLDVVRGDLGLAKTDKRFPKKGTCLAIYSHGVNGGRPLAETLADDYPWCRDYADELRGLFEAYVDRKDAAGVLDYDDLLLFWRGLLESEEAGPRLRERFDCVLVDEYQDTNRLQSDVLRLLKPDGRGLTVVGDDAQSIYSFRAATVRNILDFPKQYPGTEVVKLEQNYRSTQPILQAANAVLAEAREGYGKQLWSERAAGERPALVTCLDDQEQAGYLVRQILARREAGLPLRRQAVLFRTSHHSIVLEAELATAKIPFVKYGGLKFIEAAHVKDLLAFLRLAENPRDVVSGVRVLVLLPGIGQKHARALLEALVAAAGSLEAWTKSKPPAAAAKVWPRFVKLLRGLRETKSAELVAQVHAVRKFYAPLLEEKYDNSDARLRDLEQLELLAGRFTDRSAMLAELTLDPPSSTEDLAGDPLLDEDYLVLSTIHSAKGLEWDAVYVIHAADGNIPSDMATKNAAQIEEERRLFYVALTRAKSALVVCFPQRFYQPFGGRFGDRYGMAQLTRFLTRPAKKHFACTLAFEEEPVGATAAPQAAARRQSIRSRARAAWG